MLDKKDVEIINKIEKNSAPVYLLFSLCLPTYFILNVALNWNDFGMPGGITTITLSLLIMVILYSNWSTQNKVLSIVNKLKEYNKLQQATSEGAPEK